MENEEVEPLDTSDGFGLDGFVDNEMKDDVDGYDNIEHSKNDVAVSSNSTLSNPANKNSNISLESNAVVEVSKTSDTCNFTTTTSHSNAINHLSTANIIKNLPAACTEQLRKESTTYLKNELESNGGGGGGCQYLIAYSFYNGSIKPDDILADDLDILLQMSILVHALSTRQNKLLAAFLKLLFSKINLMITEFQETNIEGESHYCPNCICVNCCD